MFLAQALNNIKNIEAFFLMLNRGRFGYFSFVYNEICSISSLFIEVFLQCNYFTENSVSSEEKS